MRTMILLGCILALEPALGQPPSGVHNGQPVPVRIDPGQGDTSPNALSLRRLDLDLRQPSGFQHVYQISSIDAFGARQNTFMRVDGAVSAVFPRSVYVPVAGTLLPDIPPGTIFYIGGLPKFGQEPRPIPGSTFLDLSVDNTPSGAPELPPPPVVRVSSMFTDEGYRHRRLEALMSQAIEP
jgi:hypothetical protein